MGDVDSFETAVTSLKTLYQNRNVLWGAVAGGVFSGLINLVLLLIGFDNSNLKASPALLGGLLVAVLVIALVALVVEPLISAYVVAAAYYTSKKRGELLKIALSRWLSMLVGGILYAIVVTIGILLLVAPGVYIALRLFTYQASIVIDKNSPINAFKKAWATTKGNLWGIFGIMIILVLIIVILDIAFELVSVPFGAGVVGFVDYATVVASVLVFIQLAPQKPAASKRGARKRRR